MHAVRGNRLQPLTPGPQKHGSGHVSPDTSSGMKGVAGALNIVASVLLLITTWGEAELIQHFDSLDPPVCTAVSKKMPELIQHFDGPQGKQNALARFSL